jgi:hypothetical protein
MFLSASLCKWQCMQGADAPPRHTHMLGFCGQRRHLCVFATPCYLCVFVGGSCFTCLHMPF